jgi:hypothetical protein
MRKEKENGEERVGKDRIDHRSKHGRKLVHDNRAYER